MQMYWPLPKERDVITIEHKRLLPNGTIISENVHYLPNGNTFNGNELKTPDAGKYTCDYYYLYSTGEKVNQDRSFQLPNELKITNNGNIIFFKGSVFPPSTLTGKHLEIWASCNLSLDQNAAYHIKGRILHPDGRLEYNKQNISIVSAIGYYNQNEIDQNLKQFQKLYKKGILISSRFRKFMFLSDN